jgi:RecA-family ATPase
MVDILTFKELLAQPEPPWLIQDIIRADQVGVVYGPPNKGKTFLVLDWGMHVAAGLPWVGRPTTQGPVLYMAGEGAFSLQKRGAAWAHHHARPDVPIYFQTRPIDMRSDDVLGELHGALEEWQDAETHEAQLNPRLIIVDTLSQFFGGGDENGSDMAQFVDACRNLSLNRETAVLIVHHTNATGLRERGNTALRGNTDVMFEVQAVEEQGKLVGLKVINDKQRDDPKHSALSLRIVACQESLVITGPLSKEVSRHVKTLTNERLRDLLSCALSVEDKEREIVSLSDWMRISPLQHRTFYRHLHKLLDMKLIKSAGRGFYKLTADGRETAFELLTPPPNDTEKPQPSTHPLS